MRGLKQINFLESMTSITAYVARSAPLMRGLKQDVFHFKKDREIKSRGLPR